jgi:hypothetical protein
MSDEGAARRPGTFVWVLIGVRFLLELALWSSFTIASVRLIDGPVGWVAGALLTALSIALWAVLLSPRRPVRLPLAVRVAVELALFLESTSSDGASKRRTPKPARSHSSQRIRWHTCHAAAAPIPRNRCAALNPPLATVKRRELRTQADSLSSRIVRSDLRYNSIVRLLSRQTHGAVRRETTPAAVS